MPLAPLIAPDRLDALLQSVVVPDALREAALEWHDKLSGYQSGIVKEQQNRGQILQAIFRVGLGFKPDGTVPQELPFTMREEQKTEVRQDFPDASFGRFGGIEREDATTAPPRHSAIPALPADDFALSNLANQAVAVPPSQLGEEAWLLVNEAQGAVISRRAAKGISLREYLGDTPICWGIKTGLNDAFWLSQAQCDEITAKNPEAKEVLKPLVIGDEVRRWVIRQDEPRWLIYTPKNRYAETEFRDRFPAVVAHFGPFRSYTKNGKIVGLDHRATKQAWFELQQAQEAYEGFMNGPMILWPGMAGSSRFTSHPNIFTANTIYFIPTDRLALLAFLNGRGLEDHIQSSSGQIQGATNRFQEQYLETFVIPHPSAIWDGLECAVSTLLTLCGETESIRRPFLRFLRQDAPWRIATVGERLSEFWTLKPEEALAEALKRRDKHTKEPTAGQREHFLKECREAREQILEAQDRIAKLETELNIAVDAAWEA